MLAFYRFYRTNHNYRQQKENGNDCNEGGDLEVMYFGGQGERKDDKEYHYCPDKVSIKGRDKYININIDKEGYGMRGRIVEYLFK